jgi:zinc-ribbon domain
MFCPKCATQNIDGAHFCRSCGANISLVPHALAGELPAAVEEDRGRSRRRRRGKPSQPSVEEGIRSLMTGGGFLAVAIALAIFGRPIGAQVWWFWMLLPAFGLMGRGLAEIIRARQINPPAGTQQLPYVTPPESLPASKTSELKPPVPSVTEGTTRHLGAEAPTRNSNPWDDQKSS